MDPTQTTEPHADLSPAEELEQIEAEERAYNETVRARKKAALAKLDEQAEQARAELERLEAARSRARASLGDASPVEARSFKGRVRRAEPREQPENAARARLASETRRRRKATNRELILEYLRENPGQTVGEVLGWIQQYKPATTGPTVQGELWRMSKKNLVQSTGKHGRQRYIVVGAKVGADHEREATATQNGASVAARVRETLRANPSETYTLPELAKALGDVNEKTLSGIVSRLERERDSVKRVKRGVYRYRGEVGGA